MHSPMNWFEVMFACCSLSLIIRARLNENPIIIRQGEFIHYFLMFTLHKIFQMMVFITFLYKILCSSSTFVLFGVMRYDIDKRRDLDAGSA